ncbi:MAG: permease of phosphate ABC transporter [Clostridiales bacterium]|nr:permease of phosphate ABC transporter [Clostridiales bacterium]
MNLFKSVDDCAKKFSLLDFGLLKLCVGSAGLIAGLLVPKKNKKSTLATASIVFSLTLFPLMFKFVKILADNRELKF